MNCWLGSAPWEAGEDVAPLAFGGDRLAAAGLPLPPMAAEAVAIFHLERAA